MSYTDVNWVAVLVAAVVGLVIGFVYFAPQLMGRTWARAAGVELQAPSQVPPMTIAISVVAVLVTSYVLELFVRGTGADGLVDGAIVGFLAWLGFVATWTLSGTVFERRPWTYFYVTAGQGLLSLLVMGAILGAMG